MAPTSSHHNSRRPVGKQAVTPARAKPAPPAAAAPASTSARSTSATPAPDGADLALPHERDESTHTTADGVDPVMAQAKRDIDAGLVDTDMRATPGLDAALRTKLVPGPGGKAPGTGS